MESTDQQPDEQSKASAQIRNLTQVKADELWIKRSNDFVERFKANSTAILKVKDELGLAEESGGGTGRFRNTDSGESIEATTIEEREVILIGLALKLPYKVIINEITLRRKERGYPKEFSYTALKYYTNNFKHIIDEIYIELATYVGSVFSYADKLVRIGKLNELAEAIHPFVLGDLKTNREDDVVYKKGNLYLKILSRIDAEMGSKPLTGMFKKNPTEDEVGDISDNELGLSKGELVEIVKEAIDEKYVGQLPATVRHKVEYTNYIDCANGEKMGEYVVVCWNDKMTNDNAGTQCPVQKGELKDCPKFLSRKYLEDKDYLTRMKSRGLTVVDIAIAVGCKEYDSDIKDRVSFFLKKFDIIGRIPNEETVDIAKKLLAYQPPVEVNFDEDVEVEQVEEVKEEVKTDGVDGNSEQISSEESPETSGQGDREEGK